jgi:hypothetical protein
MRDIVKGVDLIWLASLGLTFGSTGPRLLQIL